MPLVVPPWVEGEKIPEDRLNEIFRQPPSVPPQFLRSSLIIGSRGAGKTTLLRYHKLNHKGIAVHVGLADAFSCLTKQTAYGPFAFDIPDTLQPVLISKAISVLAIALAEQLIRKNIRLGSHELNCCLPESFRTSNAEVETLWLEETRKSVAAAALDVFAGTSDTTSLRDFVSAMAAAAEESHGPLLVLFDKADMVLSPSLIPVLELLDQSRGFIALLAHADQALADVTSGGVAGDHYGVSHLGISPRSAEWSAFVSDAIRAQLGSSLEKVSPDSRAWMIAVSRDSLKNGLELFARYLAVSEDKAESELVQALDDLKENQLTAAQRVLQMYHPDFRDLVNRLRASAISQYGEISGPIILAMKEPSQGLLFEQPSRTTRFLGLAVRTGALCMPENFRWVPGSLPQSFELPPLLAWRKGDPSWRIESAPLLEVVLEGEKLLKQLGGPPRPPIIFLAYRMNLPDSQKFRKEFQGAVRTHPDLGSARVVDGHVYAGETWAETIRYRIRGSKLLVGDVTGMRPDVLFELGFAYGLKKPLIPVVATPSDANDLPRWLNATQLGFFKTQDGLLGIVASVAKHLSDPSYFKIARPRRPIPSLVVWLRKLDWNAHALEQFVTTVNRGSLQSEILTVTLEASIRRASTASLLVVSLDGTKDDALIHYICGAVAARPKAGAGQKTLARKILVLEEPGSNTGSYAADSLRRCEDTVSIVQLDEIKSHAEHFLADYRNWASSGN
jgi:hypothetical protein